MTFVLARRRCPGVQRRKTGERNSPVPALILGGHLTGLGVLRLLAGHGVNAYALDAHDGDMMTRSRWYRSAPSRMAETADSARLAECLGSLPFERAPLLPCTDAWTRAVAGLPDEIRAQFPASVSARATIDQFVDKDRFRTLIEALDVPRPRCLMLHADRDLAAISETDIVAGFLKPTNSQLFSSRFEGKGLWVRDRREAARLVAVARDAGIDLMLQEWIPGDPFITS